jgi:hypothetical protein
MDGGVRPSGRTERIGKSPFRRLVSADGGNENGIRTDRDIDIVDGRSAEPARSTDAPECPPPDP